MAPRIDALHLAGQAIETTSLVSRILYQASQTMQRITGLEISLQAIYGPYDPDELDADDPEQAELDTALIETEHCCPEGWGKRYLINAQIAGARAICVLQLQSEENKIVLPHLISDNAMMTFDSHEVQYIEPQLIQALGDLLLERAQVPEYTVNLNIELSARSPMQIRQQLEKLAESIKLDKELSPDQLYEEGLEVRISAPS